MAKVNVYLPDELEREVREAGLAISPLCQTALREALDRLAALRSRHVGRADLAAHGGRGRFTPRLRAVLEAAETEAAGRGRQVGALDLLGAVLDHGENLGARVLAAAGVELPGPGFRRSGRGGPAKGRGELSTEARDVLARAFSLALELRHDHVGTEHVVLALAGEEGPAGAMFGALGLDERALRRHVERLIENPWSVTAPADGTAPADHPTLDRLEEEVHRLAAEIARLRGGATR